VGWVIVKIAGVLKLYPVAPDGKVLGKVGHVSPEATW
jgi:hypothetical protein